jgi:hypothetical protein
MSIAAISAACLSEFRPKNSLNGYCAPLSVGAGEFVEFFVSSRVSFQTFIIRLTDVADGADGVAPELELELDELAAKPAQFQRAGLRVWQDGCGWQATHRFQIPLTYASGLYAAECRGSDGSICHITFTVRPAKSSGNRVLVFANTNTWNAYNDWGGQSRYTRRDREIFRLSFDRPNPHASPNYESQTDAHLVRAELWLLRWLLKLEYGFDVCTDSDVSEGTIDLNQYGAVLLSTHPEYWTREMVSRLREYLDQGGNLLYLGGNGIFEAVCLSQDLKFLIFHDGKIGPNVARSPYYFRNLNGQVCEREFLGVAFLYDNYSSPPGPYRVLEPSHWIFDGTDSNRDRLIGKGGYRGGACGREMDTSIGVGGRPGPNTPDVNAWLVPEDGTSGSDRGAPPINVVVLAEGTNASQISTHTGQMTCYETKAGGFVFSVGSYCFTGTLPFDEVLQQMVVNALARALR